MCAIITLAGGTLVTVKILIPHKDSAVIIPNSADQSSPHPAIPNSPNSVSTEQLYNAMLSAGAVSMDRTLESTGMALSQIGAACGGRLSGDIATAYETIDDITGSAILTETLVAWDSAADADQAIINDRRVVNQDDSCSVTSKGITTQYTGDFAGSPPSSCVDPGQYFATEIKATSPSSKFASYGFMVEAQCGTTTIAIRTYNGEPGAANPQVANGYLISAVRKLKSTTL